MTEYQIELVNEFKRHLSSLVTHEEFQDACRHIYAMYNQEWFLKHTVKELVNLGTKIRGRDPRMNLVVDLSYICYAVWTVLPVEDRNNFDLAAEAHINKYARTIGTSCIHIAVDDGKSFRYKLTNKYKSTRPPVDPVFGEAVARTVKHLESTGKYRVYHSDEHEADDIIGTVTMIAGCYGDKCTIIADDRDMWQCLSKLNCMHTKGKTFTADDLMEIHKILPSQAPEWLAMVGKNDLPGMPEIGKKRASELLQRFGSIANAEDCLWITERDKPIWEKWSQFFRDFHRLRSCYFLNRTLPLVYT
jgi:hypothetical protein